ncbi:MAG: mannose-1-phosphate guanylyltransferase/mannose-6-phosphate isomerase [Syntrophorhabdaceae bacterium]|nr:mannose-1-phosphate guanylyltransferase/mannose-6-phosphate isomerase [Syntrophorhabdaceae bacterium]
MKALILAGGKGTRLWPLSRKSYPKQFLKIFGEDSLLKITAERILKIVKPEDVIVITGKDYEFYVRSDLPWVRHIILEPVGRNTAPAIAIAAKYCLERMGCKEEEVIFVSPSDHIIEPEERFKEYAGYAEEGAKNGLIVTFGIKPLRPETGYGYIKADGEKHLLPNLKKVERFIEKPDMERAEGFIKQGGYYWNSGMFVFTISTIMEGFKRYLPAVKDGMEADFNEMLKRFHSLPNISIDYGVMEKADNVAVVTADLYWNDVGSWDFLYELPEGMKRRILKGKEHKTVNTENTFIISNKRLVAALGIRDCVVVDTDDALLLMGKGYGQYVKDVVEEITRQGRVEAEGHITTYRPWGSFTNLIEGDGYKVKRILVNPGGILSLQLHMHRAERWTIVKGKAKVTIGDRIINMNENDHVYIPMSVPHRVENCEDTPLEIIEVQLGSYTGEDDIVRLEDKYGRV